jgi:AraC-like DNA-binding protein
MFIDVDHETDDVDEAERLMNRVYDKGTVHESATPFSFQQRVLGTEQVNIARFRIISRTELSVDLDGVLGVGTCHGGDYRATSNGQTLDTTRPFVLSPGLAESWSSVLDLTVVNFDLDTLRTFAGAESPRDRLRWVMTGPVTPEAGGHWRHVAGDAIGVFSTPSLVDNALVHRATTDLLLASAINTFGMEVDLVASPAGDAALPSAVQRAVRYIEDSAHDPIGVSEIAEVGRLSVRGLQVAFKRTLGTTPLEYVRLVRLREARAELLAADPATTRLTAVAQRWGFTNLGRFSASYRDAYGESPRDTLQR